MDQIVRDPAHTSRRVEADPREGMDAPAEDRRTSERSPRRDTLDIRTEPRSETEARAPKKPDDKDGQDGKPDASEKKDAASNSQVDAGKDGEGKDGEYKDGEDKPAGRFAWLRQHPFLAIGGAVALIAAVIGATVWYLEARHFESSDDAFVDARQFSVAPRVAGPIVEVHVSDNQFVREGDLLFRIDPRDYTIAVAQARAALAQTEAQIGNVDAQIESQKAQVEVAEAQLKQADAALELARQEEARAADLVSKGAGTLQNEQQRRANFLQAQADQARARAALGAAQRQVASLQAQRRSAEANRDASAAQLAQAEQNLAYTDVRAAQAGKIARLTGAVGQFAQAGQALTMYVPDRLWVTANFKETQITDMRPGQKVTIRVDAYPDRRIEGHIDSIQPGSGTAFSLLPAENATGNYVKVVQRVPVKIVFDEIPRDVTLGPGMSVVPRVRVR